MEPDAATRLIAKLRTFATETLDEEERSFLALLLAPGIERAYGDADEVRGFGVEEWSGASLAEAVAALRAAGVRVVGLEDD